MTSHYLPFFPVLCPNGHWLTDLLAEHLQDPKFNNSTPLSFHFHTTGHSPPVHVPVFGLRLHRHHPGSGLRSELELAFPFRSLSHLDSTYRMSYSETYRTSFLSYFITLTPPILHLLLFLLPPITHLTIVISVPVEYARLHTHTLTIQPITHIPIRYQPPTITSTSHTC